MSNIQDKLIAGGLKEVQKKAKKGEKIQGMGYDTVYKLLTGKDANKKYKGPLPKSKPKMSKAQREANDREAGAGRLGEQDQKMMYGGKVEKYFGGGAVRGMGRAYQGGKRGCKIR
jgi:hypothetical protein